MDQISANLGLVLEEARAALAQQHADLSAIRSRTSTILSFAGLAAAFFGGLALRDDGPLRNWTYASSAAFAGVVLAVVYVTLPRTFTFSNDARTMLDDWDLEHRSADDTARHLAGFLAQHVAENQPRLDRLAWAYITATALFVMEVLFLFLDLRGR